MKLTYSCYTILIIVVSVECGLVKQFFGNVKEDVHTVVDGAVNVIGKGTHKITEGLGVFLHRNEGNKFPGTKKEASASVNQISDNEKKEDTNNNNGETHNKHEDTAGGNDDSQNYNHVLPTPATNSEDNSNSGNNIHVPQHTQQNEPITETNINKSVKQHEAISNHENIIHDNTVVSTTATNTGTTTETWLNGAELENILPTITHNETHFTGNTNELGIGENPKEETKESNKTAKCDENVKPTSQNNGTKANLVSDQMFFNDNKPKENEASSNYVCAEGLVRTANGQCLKQIEIDVRKKVEPMVSNIFVADGCASGYARALDGSCQKIVG